MEHAAMGVGNDFESSDICSFFPLARVSVSCVRSFQLLPKCQARPVQVAFNSKLCGCQKTNAKAFDSGFEGIGAARDLGRKLRSVHRRIGPEWGCDSPVLSGSGT